MHACMSTHILVMMCVSPGLSRMSAPTHHYDSFEPLACGERIVDEKHNRVCVCVSMNMYIMCTCGCAVCPRVRQRAYSVCVCSVMWLVMWRPAGDGPWREPAG